MGQCCQRRRAANEDCAEDLAPQDDVSLSAASESVWTPPMTAHQRRTTVSTRSLTEEALIEALQDEMSLSAASVSVWTPPMTAHQRRATVSTRSREEALIEVVNDETRTAEVRAYAQAELDRR